MVPGVFLLTAPAHAQDTSAEVEAEIDKAWRELEPIIEEHNSVRGKLKDKRQAAKELADKIKPLELKVDVARAGIAGIAAYSFKGGNMSAFRALLTTGSPTTFADQLSTLDQVARSQRLKILKVLETKAEYEAEKAELDKLVEELSTMESELAEKADEIDAEIDRLKDLRDELREQEEPEDTGTGGDCPASNPGGGAGSAITFACAQIGKAYGWGQAGPDAYDCSGLTMAAWNQGGVSLPHNAAEQRSAVPYVERANLIPGDLVFYYGDLSHVGMYAGAGWVVHASNPSDPVHMAPIDESPVHSYGRPGG